MDVAIRNEALLCVSLREPSADGCCVGVDCLSEYAADCQLTLDVAAWCTCCTERLRRVQPLSVLYRAVVPVQFSAVVSSLVSLPDKKNSNTIELID